MAKFQGVISNFYRHPSDDCVLEFTDLNLIADVLIHETQDLLYEFHLKSEVIREQEISLVQNLNKITEIYELCHMLHLKTLELEREAQNIGQWLCCMEKSIDCMNRIPTSFAACKCSSNLERSTTLEKLLQLSKDTTDIENQLVLVQNQEKILPVTDPCDFTKRLLPFLDIYLQILVTIEHKADKISDQLQEVDGYFLNAYKRKIGACYHKPRHEPASDC